MITNEDRQKRGRQVTEYYAALCGQEGEAPALNLGDLLSDLRHYADTLSEEERDAEKPDDFWEVVMFNGLAQYDDEIEDSKHSCPDCEELH